MPKKNEQDLLEDLPQELRDQMEFVFAGEIRDVLETAIDGYAEIEPHHEVGSNGDGHARPKRKKEKGEKADKGNKGDRAAAAKA
jgi:ATP-dependent Lon protease